MDQRGTEPRAGIDSEPVTTVWDDTRQVEPASTRAHRAQSWAALLVLAGIVALVAYKVATRPQYNNATASAAPSPAVAEDDHRAAVQAWFQNGGRAHMAALTSDIDMLSTASGALDSRATLRACLMFQVDVESAQRYAPLPDATVQASWSSGLASFYKATGDCVAGVSATDASLIEQSSTEISRGSAYFSQAAAQVTAMGG